MEEEKAKAPIPGRTRKGTKETTSITNVRERALSPGPMVRNTLARGKMARNKARESTLTQPTRV